jgi:hypothetical protein
MGERPPTVYPDQRTAATIISRSPRRVVELRPTASPRPSTTRVMPANVANTPRAARRVGGSCPAAAESRRVQAGVVASRRLAFPAKVQSIPNTKQSW